MSLSNLRINQLLVADTSPLLALARLDFLVLLGQLFSSVCVTQTVITECLAKPESSDAKAHHLNVVGTLGISLLAKRKGLLPFIKPKIFELKRSGYFISDLLISHILELADE